MIDCQREAFDLPDDVAYFNCAYMAPTLKVARRAADEALARTSQPWKISPTDFFTPVERLRRLFAELIGASADDVAIVPSASFGLSTAAKNLRLGPGKSVLVLDGEFPSNVYPWRELARRSGGQVRHVPRPDDGDWTAAVLRALDRDVAIAALPHCHWTDGAALDLARIAPELAARDIRLAMDATQSLGVMPLDVRALGVDFLACAAYKWLLGPYAVSFLYTAPAHQRGEPIDHAWINRERSEDFAGLVNYRDEYQAGARRYDSGERSSFVLLPMAIAALEQVLQWGPPAISATLRALTDDLAARATRCGALALPAHLRAPHLLGLRFAGGTSGLVESLRARNVFVSVRGDTMRVAPHLWTRPADVERLLAALPALAR